MSVTGRDELVMTRDSHGSHLTDAQWERHKSGEFSWKWTSAGYEAVNRDGICGAATTLPSAVDAMDAVVKGRAL